MQLLPSRFIWFNGALVPWEQAQVHVMTHALHYGSSVFEGIRAYATPRGPAVFCLDEHVARLFDSCRIGHLPLEHSQAAIAAAIVETVRRNEHDACYIRPLVFRGYGALGVWPGDCPVEIVIATFPWVRAGPKDVLETGIDVGVSSWRRMAPDTHPALAKSAGNYVNSALAVIEARRHGYHESIMLDVDGYASEGSGQNLFVVHGGVLRTPPIGASILAGITRACVIELAGDLGLGVVEERIPRELLSIADEVFLTGTAAEITPVRSVDGLPVGDGRRGRVTESLQERFFGTIRGEYDDEHAWLTFVH